MHQIDAKWRDRPHGNDVAAVKSLLLTTELFNDEEISVAGELVIEALSKGEESGYLFRMIDHADRLIGFSCFGPVRGTKSSWDVYWIAIDAAVQGCGLGGELLSRVESVVAGCFGRRIYIETSSRIQYAPTRAFYEHCGYARAAVVVNYFEEGDDKIIYTKLVESSRM